MSEEILNRITRIKRMLKDLLEKGDLDYALEIVRQYEKVVLNDVEILSFKGVIYYAKNELDKAEEIFKEALLIDSTYFDLYFNLGCLFETKNDYKKAVRYFNRASEFSNSEEEKKEILRKIEYYKQITDIPTEKKIAFFIRKGLDNFIDDIILGLMDDYFVRKIIVTDFKQIDEGMQWADICWFEWCDELVIYGSRHELAREKKLICRIHRYEAFSNYIFQVEWGNIDKVIFVASHILDIVNSKLQGNVEDKSIIIPNGIRLQDYNFRNRKKGFNIAYVGYLNYRKSPNMLLQLINKLKQIDERYRLFIAGEFQDEENVIYFKYMLKEMGLEDHVILEGWQKDINTWLEDKDYVVSCSISEGHPVGIMEAMAKGIKPVIHNFVGAKDIYPKEWLWDTINEAVNMISEEKYNSEVYRSFIENHYSFDRQLNQIRKLIDEMEIIREVTIIENDDHNKVNITQEEIKKYYNNFTSYLKNDRKRENPRHMYIKNRLKELIKSDYSVLDCGCGVGIISEFIKSLGVKEVIGIDISSENIKYALETVKDVIFLEGDMVEISLNKKFDVILMIDVLEHIPVERYSHLFNNIKRHLKESGYIYISIPTYEYNKFIKTYRPELLQIVDNSISMEMIIDICKNNKLKILFYNTYGIDVHFQYNEYIIVHEPQYHQIWSNLISQL